MYSLWYTWIWICIYFTHTHTYVRTYEQTAFKKEMATFTLHIWSLKLSSVMLSQLLKRLCRKLSQYCFYFWEMKQTLGINHFKEPNSYQLRSVISSRILASLVTYRVASIPHPRDPAKLEHGTSTLPTAEDTGWC